MLSLYRKKKKKHLNRPDTSFIMVGSQLERLFIHIFGLQSRHIGGILMKRFHLENGKFNFKLFLFCFVATHERTVAITNIFKTYT